MYIYTALSRQKRVGKMTIDEKKAYMNKDRLRKKKERGDVISYSSMMYKGLTSWILR